MTPPFAPPPEYHDPRPSHRPDGPSPVPDRTRLDVTPARTRDAFLVPRSSIAHPGNPAYALRPTDAERTEYIRTYGTLDGLLPSVTGARHNYHQDHPDHARDHVYGPDTQDRLADRYPVRYDGGRGLAIYAAVVVLVVVFVLVVLPALLT